jgi:diaminopropionate ammonia-lyase
MTSPRSTEHSLFVNPRVDRTSPYADRGRARILSLAALEHARREIVSWPGYAPTPLRDLSGLARANDLDRILL